MAHKSQLYTNTSTVASGVATTLEYRKRYTDYEDFAQILISNTKSLFMIPTWFIRINDDLMSKTIKLKYNQNLV